MVERRLLLINGISGRGTKYFVNRDFQKSLANGGESGLQSDFEGASMNINDLQYSIEDLQHKSESLQHKKAYVPGSKPGYHEVDETVFDEIYQKASMTKRIDSMKMEAFIMEACQTMPCTVEELSILLSRDKASLRNHYLYRMVKEGKLRLLYPQEANHPAQAYLTTVASGLSQSQNLIDWHKDRLERIGV